MRSLYGMFIAPDVGREFAGLSTLEAGLLTLLGGLRGVGAVGLCIVVFVVEDDKLREDGVGGRAAGRGSGGVTLLGRGLGVVEDGGGMTGRLEAGGGTLGFAMLRDLDVGGGGMRRLP